MPRMLILRGNSGTYPDEEGNPHKYKKGALHDHAAMEYARRVGYEPVVLDMSGDPGPGPNRGSSPQTLAALDWIYGDPEFAALYGFSGGGYNIWWILRELKEKDLKRIERIVVLGVDDDAPESGYHKSKFKGARWELVYRKNPPASASVIKKRPVRTCSAPSGCSRIRPIPPRKNPDTAPGASALEPRELGGAGGDVGDGKEAEKDQRLGSGIARHVLFAGRNEHDVARLDGDLTALRHSRPLPRQHVDALLESVVEMRTARCVARFGWRDLGDAKGDARADVARHRLERRAPGKPEPLRLALLQEPRHQRTRAPLPKFVLPRSTL
jgi:hypothetical protein